jgi:hypothetical protein
MRGIAYFAWAAVGVGLFFTAAPVWTTVGALLIVALVVWLIIQGIAGFGRDIRMLDQAGRESAKRTARCPHCYERIMPKAKVCPYCRQPVEAQRVVQPKPQPRLSPLGQRHRPSQDRYGN